MSNNESSGSRLGDYVQLAVAAARAAYGDFTGIAVEALKYAPQIIAVVCAVVIVLVILPALFIQSLFTGSNGSPSGTFSEMAVEALTYKEDWIRVLAAAQTKKVLSGSDSISLAEAALAVKSNTVESYLRGSSKDNVLDIYNSNLELLQNLLCSYAGYVYYYDEIPAPSSYESINCVYNPAYGFYILEATVTTEKGVQREVIYSSNDVASFKVDNGVVKIKYRKYTFKAWFPIPEEYSVSYTDDFGGDRLNNGQHQGHEGNDIFAPRNTPVIAVEGCRISKIGWNGLGGWRVLLESLDGVRTYYYAHMESYAPNLQKYKDYSGRVVENPGIEVKAGEVVGYVGSSGSFASSTPPGADTGTPPHLHFQLWVKSKGWFGDKETLLNPYYCLKLLENSRYSEEVHLNEERLAKEGL